MTKSGSHPAESSKPAGRGRLRFLHRRWQALLFALLASALSLAAYWLRPELLENLDRRSRDVVFRWREPIAPPADVAIVAIDEASLKAHGRWPWSRGTQARLIGRLKEYRPAVIALDIVYAQMSGQSCQCDDEDAVLTGALREDGAAVIGGYFFRPERTGEAEREARDLLAANRIKQILIKPGGRLDTVPEFRHVETSEAVFARKMAGLGFFNRDTDVDGLVRSVPLVMRFDGELYPSLALRALAAYRGVEAGVSADPTGIAGIRLGPRPIPVDEKGRLTANFYALEDGIPVFPAAEVMAGKVDPGHLRDRLVFVGVTETGVGDLVPTPVHGLFPGVAVHATAAGNIIQEHYLHNDLGTVLYDVALIAFIPLVSILFVVFMGRPSRMIAAMLFLSALLAGVFYYLVAYRAQLVSLVYPAAALIVAFTAFQVYYMLTTQRTARFLTGAFSSYVSPDVVDRLLLTPDSLGLSGEEREISVLFSDIRGFTGIAERLEPKSLVDMLNLLFDEMTAIVLAHGGTLDKFIGDAIMALFNAPLNLDGHQAHSARAALAMIERLDEIRPDFEARYGVELNIGVGLHSGKAVVGNLGSSQRFDYTAVGDAVNLASRVESLSKYYRVPIIHTRAIDAQLDGGFLRRLLDRIRVSGKREYAEIFQLMPPQAENRELAGKFTAAIECYFSMAFDRARERFEDILAQFPDDGPAQILVERCRGFLEHPPPGDWDGIFEAESK